MKTPTFKSLGSKTAKTFFALAVLTLAGVTACKKDASTSTSATVTEADAAQMTSDAVSSSTGGMSAQTTSSVTLYAGTTTTAEGCGLNKDTTITASYSSGNYSFGYTLSWAYDVSCDTHVATLNYNGNSSYSGLLTTISGSCVGEDVLSGIASSATYYTLNGSFERKGNATSKVGEMKSFTSDLKISTTNATVDKTTDEITGGTATVTLTGATSGGKSFSFGGTLTFLGGKTGKLVLNSGTSYNLTWE